MVDLEATPVWGVAGRGIKIALTTLAQAALDLETGHLRATSAAPQCGHAPAARRLVLAGEPVPRAGNRK
jgi:hypothetical protein